MILRALLDVVKCPRCGMDHKALVKAYTTAIVLPGGVTITHYAFCENFDEPILITQIDEGEGTVAFWRFQ